MKLSNEFREELVDELDGYFDSIDSPEPEAVVAYLIDILETYADDRGIDDFISALEEEGTVDGTLSEALEEELGSNEEFEYTGEEIVVLLERVCGIEWDNDDDFDDDDDDDLDDEDDDL